MGLLGFVGFVGRLAHGAAGAAFDAAELAPDTFAQGDRQLVSFGLIAKTVTLSLPSDVKDLLNCQSGANAD